MAFLRTITRPPLRRSCSTYPNRGYAAKATKKESQPTLQSESSLSSFPRKFKLCLFPPAVSSCPANTLLPGLNYLKGQPPVLALPDEEYPSWLWTLLQPRVEVDEGLGSLAEKRRMKKERTANIKYANFLKTQL